MLIKIYFGKVITTMAWNFQYLGDMQNIAEYLKENVRAGDTLVIMGAGDICKLFTMMELD